MVKLFINRILIVIGITICGGFLENSKCLAASENNALSYQVINYKSWYSGNYQMRVYKGTKTALLIPDEWFANLIPEQNTINLYGEWKGISDQAIAFTLSWLDKGYDFYYSFTGQAPANSAITPGYIPIAFVDSSCGAGCGLIGGAGIEIGKAYFVYQVYSAALGEMIQTIFWHELGRNFSVGTGSTYFDVGVKYVLVNELNVPTNMNGEYGVLYEQFLLDQSYLLPRYYMADSNSSIDGLDGGASKPSIPEGLLSASLLWNYNGGDIRSGWVYQFYLENGFSKWKDLAKYIFNNNLGSTNSEIISKVKDKMNELSLFDYSYITKNGWSYAYDISSYAGGVFNISSSAVGSGIETGYGDDTVNISGYGQFRVDTGDGYDTVTINGLGNKYKISQFGWNATLVDEATATFVSLNFVEKLVVNGVAYELSTKYSNTLPPIVKYIESSTGGLKIKNGDDLVVGFTEPVYFEGNCDGDIFGLRDAESLYFVDTFKISDGSLALLGDSVIFKNVHGIDVGRKYEIVPFCGWFFDGYHNMVEPLAYWVSRTNPYAKKLFTGIVSIQNYTLSVSKYGTGSVVSSPFGINCGSVCSYSFANSISVKLTASPYIGYVFAGWTGDCLGLKTCDLVMNLDANVSALFFPALDVSQNLTGQITAGAGSTAYINVPYTNSEQVNSSDFIVGSGRNIQIQFPGYFTDITPQFHELVGSIKVQGNSYDYIATSYYAMVKLTHKTTGQTIEFQVTRPSGGRNNSGVTVEFLDGAIAFTSHLTPPLPELKNGRWTMWITKGGVGTEFWGTVPAIQTLPDSPVDLIRVQETGALNPAVNSRSITNWN